MSASHPEIIPASPVLKPVFEPVAGRVINRLVLRKALLFVKATWKWAVGVLGLLVLLRAIGFDAARFDVALVLTFLWLSACAGWAWYKRPGSYEAFAFWDKQAKRHDDFANAWWFEQQGAASEGGQFHIRRQSKVLESALGQLNKDISMPDVRWLGVVPVLLFGLYLLPGSSGWLLPEVVLTTEGKKLAVEEGRKLEERKLDAGKLEGLNETEKKELEQLQSKIDETAKSLQQGSSQTARDVLAELEKRARDAERMAEKLGAGDAEWASAQMIAEMRKHADTAELGDAVASRSAENTGKQAQALADTLKDDKLATEAKERFEETLRQIGKASEPADKERTVGKHVLEADKNLTQSLPKEAGNEFQALADKMKVLAQRENARKELEKLAQQLRESGSSIAGQNQQGMQQLTAQQDQAGQQGQNNQQATPTDPMTAMPNAPQIQPMQFPGMSNTSEHGQGNSGENLPILTPVPGSGQDQPQNMAIVPNPDGKLPKDNKPMLIAPVPGNPPGQKPDAVMLMGVMPGSSGGGLQAGNGTANMGNQPTKQTEAGQQATVNAQRNAEGASSVRTVEGQVRDENASRAAQPTTLEAIAAEESALDDAALPAARREQVRRYFNELRRRFETAN